MIDCVMAHLAGRVSEWHPLPRADMFSAEPSFGLAVATACVCGNEGGGIAVCERRVCVCVWGGGGGGGGGVGGMCV